MNTNQKTIRFCKIALIAVVAFAVSAANSTEAFAQKGGVKSRTANSAAGKSKAPTFNRPSGVVKPSKSTTVQPRPLLVDPRNKDLAPRVRRNWTDDNGVPSQLGLRSPGSIANIPKTNRINDPPALIVPGPHLRKAYDLNPNELSLKSSKRK